MKHSNTVVFLFCRGTMLLHAGRLECVCSDGREKIRDYHCDALAAVVLSHPRLWPFSLNEDVVANNDVLSVQRQRELKEKEEERQAEEE